MNVSWSLIKLSRYRMKSKNKGNHSKALLTASYVCFLYLSKGRAIKVKPLPQHFFTSCKQYLLLQSLQTKIDKY